MNSDSGTGPGPWDCLEQLRGQRAVLDVWRAAVGEHFDGFQAAFLQPATGAARAVPCPRGCGCSHEVVRHGDGELVGVCRCEPWRCEDLALAARDVVVWELNWARLGRALCRALGLASRDAGLSLPRTRQIGSWSADAVPVVLTLQSTRREFRHVVAQLVARLRGRFILLAPTSRFLDAACLEQLAAVAAGFFGLDRHVRLGRHGWLEPVAAPGEWLAPFSPTIPVPDEDVARRAFAIVRTLDTGSRASRAPLLKVFRLYCVENLSVSEIARRCRCSRPMVFARLKLLRQKTGLSPVKLRGYSAQFETIESSLSDPRARRIHRKKAIYGVEAETEA